MSSPAAQRHGGGGGELIRQGFAELYRTNLEEKDDLERRWQHVTFLGVHKLHYI
jgi:hypothetical protein